jgi:hypothetical protein
MGVAPSRDHGGCGQIHSRPVEHGAPAKLWALTCPDCEKHLRSSDQWSATVSGIPETPDETLEREDREKRGQQETTAATATALQQLGENLPEALRELVAQGGTNQQMMLAMLTALTKQNAPLALAPAVPDVQCVNGHAMPGAAKFCPECGGPFETAPVPEPTDIADATGVQDVPDFESMSIRDLQAYAAERGIKTTRAKADQIDLILAAQG